VPKTEEEYRKIREAQRENILSAAKIALLRYGWAVTMADIATEAKISQGLAYRYFNSKEAIFAELFDQMLEKTISISVSTIENSTPTLRLKALISRIMSGSDIFGNFEIALRASFEKSPAHSISDYMSLDENGCKLMEIIKSKFDSFKDLVAEIIKEGQKTGEFINEDPQKLTLMLLSTIKGMTHLAIHQYEIYKAFYPYTDLIMRLIVNESYKAPEAEKGANSEPAITA
jgi:AcrR family transcriptional regulator